MAGKNRKARYSTLFLTSVALAISSPTLYAADTNTTRITTVDGKHYDVINPADPASGKKYFILAGQEYIPLDEVRQITRINLGRAQLRFLAILSDGSFVEGNHGRFFFEQVRYTDPQSGETKSGFAAVLKERGSNGLVLQHYDAARDSLKRIEIANPNDIVEITFDAPDVKEVVLPVSEPKGTFSARNRASAG